MTGAEPIVYGDSKARKGWGQTEMELKHPSGSREAPEVEIQQMMAEQQAFFRSGATRAYAFRAEQLERLSQALKAREGLLTEALAADLGKPALESYATEIGFLYGELIHTRKHLKRWMKPQRVGTPLTLFPSASDIYREPLGQVLIMAPWNYPINLLLAPLIGAIAGGNCAVLKPSELAPHTSRALAELVSETFPRKYVAVVEGGVQTAEALLHRRWDHIFFTGGTGIGRIVARAAAEHLTPVTLELGGKSPCIVMADADLELSARRIVWGKFVNAGQTCVAPDYLLVSAQVKEQLLDRMRHYVTQFFGPDPKASPDLARIISGRHFDRLAAMLEGGRIVVGGQTDRASRYIAPTIIDGVDLNHKSMAEEIFGPILPVLTFYDLDEAMAIVRRMPNPLALYLFTRSKAAQERIIHELPFGGGCINDTLVHLGNPNLPFGGIGESGLGAYHGPYSFATFTHPKAMVKNTFLFDIKVRYQPYLGKLKLLKRLMR